MERIPGGLSVAGPGGADGVEVPVFVVLFLFCVVVFFVGGCVVDLVK